MRNLKRVLSLSLASVMLFGMMVVGASAAQGYPDVDRETHNIEAIDVLQTVQVMIGYTEEEGSGFQPDKPVSRAEMMVIMGKLLDLDYNYYSTSCPFTDVPDWAKGWVGAAYANKVAYGRGDGIFDPDSTVTPVEASAFLMRALGYFQYSNDYSDGFELATVRQGTAIDIYHGVSSSATEPMTRNQVAKMVLNTLESGMVQPDGNTINLTTPDGSVLTGKVNYVYVTSNKDYAYSISSVAATAIGSANTGAIVELGEQLYNGDLKLYDGRLDDFGRPSRLWEYDGQAIGTYMKKDLLKQSYTAKVTGKELYELLGSDTIKDYGFTITIDGETEKAVLHHESLGKDEKSAYYFNTTALNRSNTNQVGGTANGVLTQVFVDGNKKEVYIAIINTYLARAASDYNTSRNELLLRIWGIEQVPAVGGGNTLVKLAGKNPARTRLVTIYGEDFDVKDVKADDICLVHVAAGEVKEILAPEVIDETTITSFKTGSYVVADGTKYNYADTAEYDDDVLDDYSQTNMKNVTYRVYLDEYGYLIGIEIVESERQYVFLTGINSNPENLRDRTGIGNVIFLDGTSKNVTIDLKESENAQGASFRDARFKYNAVYGIYYDTSINSLMNTWCTYSVDEDGVYTLKEVPNTAPSYNDGANKAKHGQGRDGGTYVVDGVTYYINTGSPVNDDYDGTLKYTSGDDVVGYDDEYVKINKSSVSLNGIPNSPWKRVYGNNDTVYLTAEYEYISARQTLTNPLNNGDKPSVIITGVDAVSVGVQDVELKAYNAAAVLQNLAPKGVTNLPYADVSHGVYSLFDKNGYVIAAMVVGEDDGSNTTYAWVSSNKLESESLVDGKWEYSRKAIVDGVETVLTQVETDGNKVSDLEKYQYGNDNDYSTGFWWAVKMKADGTVKSVTPLVDTNEVHNKYNFVYDIDDANDTSGTYILNQAFNLNGFADGEKVYLNDGTIATYNTADAGRYKVRVAGNTLQVEGDTGYVRGFAVNSGAKIVVVKDEGIYRNNETDPFKWNYKSDIQYFTNDKNAAGLEQAVSYLNDNENFSGFVGAVLKDDRAEVVVIYDKTGSKVNVGGNAEEDTWIFAAEDVDNLKDEAFNVYYVSADVTATGVKIGRAIANHLRNLQGIDVVDVTYRPAAEGSKFDGVAVVRWNENGEEHTREYNVRLWDLGADENLYKAYKTYWNGKDWK